MRDRFVTESGFDALLYLLCFVYAGLAAGLKLLHLPEKLTAHPVFCTGVSLLLAIPIFAMVEFLNGNPFDNIQTWSKRFNVFLIWLLCWAVLAVSRRFWLSLRVTAVVCYVAALANDMVMEFRGQPISALDVYSWKTAASVADRYSYFFSSDFWVATTLLLLIWTLAGFARGRLRGKLVCGVNLAACVLGFGVFFYQFYETDMLENFDISDYLWNQKLAFQDNGVLLSLMYSTRYLMVDTPAGYSAQSAASILESATEETPADDVRPNIIAVMNESFADLSVVGELTTNVDPLAYYHSLIGQKNTYTGQLLISTFGGGTCNTEFEFLSGCSLAFFPSGSVVYQQYLNRAQMPSLVSTLNDQGYTSIAVHPFYAYCWNRSSVYPLLGFADFLDIKDFAGAQSIGGYMGNSVSDASDYEKLFELYESKGPDERLFLFNVTMQNHGGYSKISGCDEQVTISNLSQTYTSAENYLTLLKESDNQLKTLIDYFSQVEEPTILVFFGDHQPNLSDEFYDELYGSDPASRSLSEVQSKYKTPFFIWANYDIGSGELGTVSANYLSTLVLQAAGLKMPAFNQFLAQLYEEVPALNLNGYQTADGAEYSFEDVTDVSQRIAQYQTVQYNLMFDKKNLVDTGFVVD